MNMTDVRVIPVSYKTEQGVCSGTNVLYNLNGNPASARIPYSVDVRGAINYINNMRRGYKKENPFKLV